MRLRIELKNASIHNVATEVFSSAEKRFRSLEIEKGVYLVVTELSQSEVDSLRNSPKYSDMIKNLKILPEDSLKEGDCVEIRVNISLSQKGRDNRNKNRIFTPEDALEKFLKDTGLKLTRESFKNGSICNLLQRTSISRGGVHRFYINNRFEIKSKLQIVDLEKFKQVYQNGLYSYGTYGHGAIDIIKE